MTILLRIYFVGMIAFVPGGSEMNVLLPDLRDGYIASDGKPIESHTAFLLARSGRCEGDCTADQEPLAEMLYRKLLRGGTAEPMDLLHKAIEGGGAWELNDSDLAIEPRQDSSRGGLRILRNEAASGVPSSPVGRRSFDWVANIGRIVPEAGEIDPGLLGDRPRMGLLVARLRLGQGEIRTHRMIRVGDEVPPIDFKTLQADDQRVYFSQALAHWVLAEVPVHLPEGDCTVRLVERSLLDGGGRRAMELRPTVCEDGGVVEVAILNVPPSSFEPVKRPPTPKERIGRHFEVYYELSHHPPARNRRPVPYTVEEGGEPWSKLQPKAEELSDFLEAIVIEPGKGIASPLLCPPGQFSSP